MRTVSTACLAFGILLASAAVLGQESSGCEASDAARALCAAEKSLTEALRRNDASRLSELYADDFQLVNYHGRHVDKAGVLTALRSGALRFDSLATSELQLRVYGDAGVITGIQHQVARESGGDEKAHPKEVRFTHVCVRREGRWRLVVSQITPILSTQKAQGSARESR